MGVVIPVGEYESTFVFNCAGIAKDITWSLGITAGGIPSPGLVAIDCVTAFTTGGGVGNLGPFAATNMSNKWTFRGVSTILQTASGPLVGQSFNPITGSVAIVPLPPNCSFMFQKNTALGGRKNRGRAYIPPLNDSEAAVNEAGVLGSASVALIQEMFDDALDALAALGKTAVLHHSDGSAGTPITSMILSSLIATQRRRLR